MVDRKTNDSAAAELKFDQLSLSLRGKLLIDLDCSVVPGEVLTVMGPSGSGKSSLLAFIAGHLDPVFTAKGNVLLGGKVINTQAPEDRHVGLLFQDALLFPHMSVGENLLFAIPSNIRSKDERKKMAESGLAEIDLDGFFDRDPATLSGGQKARVALARTLLSQPQALLLDEPFSRLDQDLRAQVRSLVFDRAKDYDLPVVLVTHDHQDADAAGGAIVKIGEI